MVYRYVLFISTPIYVFGFLWFILPGVYTLDDARVQMHIQASLLFFVGLLVGGGAVWVLSATVRLPPVGRMSDASVKKLNRYLDRLGFACCIFITAYIVDNGMVKILALGSNIEGSDFRFIGLNHHNKWIQMPMELSRRAMMPFVILAKLSLRASRPELSGRSLAFFFVLFFFASIINLDRGPMFVFLVMIGFYLWHRRSNYLYKLLVMAVSLFVISVMGWVFTLAQYNNLQNFGLQSYFDTLFGLLVNRIILSPVIMGQTWVFDYTQAPLFLEHARISVLWGGDYVGSHGTFAWHVAPVGVVGDIYRNFGMGGMLFWAFILGMLLKLISNQVMKAPQEVRLPLHFVELILAIYFIHGGLFSLGPPAIMVFIFGAATVAILLFGAARGANASGYSDPPRQSWDYPPAR